MGEFRCDVDGAETCFFGGCKNTCCLDPLGGETCVGVREDMQAKTGAELVQLAAANKGKPAPDA